MLVRNKKGEEAGWDGEKIRSPHRSDKSCQHNEEQWNNALSGRNGRVLAPLCSVAG